MTGAIKVRTVFSAKKVLDKERRASIRNLFKGAFAVRKEAQESIETSDTPSEPGEPPHTKRGQFRKAILYAVDKPAMTAYIGPSARLIGPSGRAHEKGGTFRGQRYPKRPTMAPALDRKRSSLAGVWEGSVK